MDACDANIDQSDSEFDDADIDAGASRDSNEVVVDTNQSEKPADEDSQDETVYGMQRLIFLQSADEISLFQSTGNAPYQSENNPENEGGDAGNSQQVPPRQDCIYRRGLPFIKHVRAKPFLIGTDQYEEHSNGIYLQPASTHIFSPQNEREDDCDESEERVVIRLGEYTQMVTHPRRIEEEKKKMLQRKLDGANELENATCPLCEWRVDPPEGGNEETIAQTVVEFYNYYNDAVRTVDRDRVFKDMAEYWNKFIHKPWTREVDFEIPPVSASIIENHFRHSKVLQRRMNMEELEDKIDCIIDTVEKNCIYAQRFENGSPSGEIFVAEKGIKILEKLVKMKRDLSDCNIKQGLFARMGNDYDLMTGQLTIRKAAMLANQGMRKGSTIRGTNSYGAQIREYH